MDATIPRSRPRRWLIIEIWVVLGLLALIHLIVGAMFVVAMDDTENLETTLVYVAAGQFANGPEALYGPYRGKNHALLIHAPLYYRLTGLGAWPLVKLRYNAFTACFIAGRTLSASSFLALLAVVGAMARLDGAPRRAAAWAICLLAGSGVVAPYAITTRADLTGTFLQTFGVYLVLRAIQDGRPPGRKLLMAYVAFGLTFCVKQHLVAAATASTLILCGCWLRRREFRRPIERAVLAGLAVSGLYLLAEEILTAGRMSSCIFMLPATFRKFSHVGWKQVPDMMVEIGFRSLALVALGSAAWFASRRAFAERGLDAHLRLFLSMEAAVFGFTCYGNEGAWVNYGIPTIVLTCIVVGRALSTIVEASLPTWRVTPLALLGVLVLVEDFAQVRELILSKAASDAALRATYRDPAIGGWGSTETYFVGLPQYNRLFGRSDLVHDEWLYGQFERAGAAEPRVRWLLPALVSGPTHLVIVPVDPPFPIPRHDGAPVIPGLERSLTDLGFDLVTTIHRFQAWERHRLPRDGGGDKPTPRLDFSTDRGIAPALPR